MGDRDGRDENDDDAEEPANGPEEPAGGVDEPTDGDEPSPSNDPVDEADSASDADETPEANSGPSADEADAPEDDESESDEGKSANESLAEGTGWNESDLETPTPETMADAPDEWWDAGPDDMGLDRDEVDDESADGASNDDEGDGDETDGDGIDGDEEGGGGSDGGPPMGGDRTGPPRGNPPAKTGRGSPPSRTRDGDDGDDTDGTNGDDGDDGGRPEKHSRKTDPYAAATAPDDEEMPLTDHVEEMAVRVLAVGLVMFGLAAITVVWAHDLINFLWYSFIGPGIGECLNSDLAVRDSCPDEFRPRVYHPLSLVLARLKVATLVGTIGALPVAVYQTYRFMRPGLYPKERRYYLAAVPMSLVLAATGVVVAYYAILPAMFAYFNRYSQQAAELAFGLRETFNLIIIMLGFFAIIFQIPLLIMLAIMMGVTTRRWLEQRRLYFWFGFAGVAFLFNPDPTGMALLLVAGTMIGLFEGTLLVLRWTDKGSPIPSAEAAARRRPYAWLTAAVLTYLVSPAPEPASYYDAIPSLVKTVLAKGGLTSATPIVVGLVLIALFEVLAYAVRRTDMLQLRLFLIRTRKPFWAVAAIVGHFGASDPALLRLLDRVAFGWQEAAVAGVALIALYEVAIALLKLRKRHS